jgi:hypothetical protein
LSLTGKIFRTLTAIAFVVTNIFLFSQEGIAEPKPYSIGGDIGVAFDDNIFYSDNNKQHDVLSSASPSATYDYQNDNHILHCDARSWHKFYAENNTLNSNTYNVVVDYEHNFQGFVRTSLGASHSKHDTVYYADALSGAVGLYDFWTNQIKGGLGVEIGDKTLATTGVIFSNAIFDAAEIPDSNSITATAGVKHEFLPVLSFVSDLFYEYREYKNDINEDNMMVGAGLQYYPNEQLYTSANIGFQRTDSTGQDTSNGFFYSTQGSYDLNRMIKIEYLLKKSALIVSFSNEIIDLLESNVSIGYTIGKKDLLKSTISFIAAEYTVAEEKDNTIAVNTSWEHKISKHLVGRIQYTYEQRDSSTDNDYHRNLISIHIVVKF